MTEFKEILSKYLPSASLEPIIEFIVSNNVQLIITGKRKTKTGDYKPPQRNINFHRITVNYNLNSYEFLITLLHEFAHLLTWNSYKNKVLPHGKEWLENYYKLLNSEQYKEIFPKEISKVFEQIYEHPHITRTEISRILKKYDLESNLSLVEDLEFNICFETEDGRKFKKLEKLKKRYKCYCISDKKYYVFSPLAKVKPCA